MEELLHVHSGDPALHLKMARLCAKKGESARAILEYRLCLTVAPQDAEAKKELDSFQAFLKANGRMPAMNLYNIMMSDMARRPD